MELVFATQNLHKKTEMEALLASHSLVMPSDLSIDYSFEETGESLLENALGKAMHLYKLCKKPTFADDTGLFVDALGGNPGVKTARYGEEVFGRQLESYERNEYLLTNLKGFEGNARSARFACAIALVLDEQRIFIFQETLEGFIAQSQEGKEGFGYDPLFYVPTHSTTLAQLPSEEKNSISHRAKSAKALLALLDSLDKENR